MNKKAMNVCIEAFPSYLFIFFRSSRIKSAKEKKSVERMRYKIYIEKKKYLLLSKNVFQISVTQTKCHSICKFF